MEMQKREIRFSPPDITDAEINEVIEALKSGWITTGPKTKELEKLVAKRCHAAKAACLNSNTACAELTLRILGIGEGDEVIVPAYTYTATASVACHVGAKIVMIDCEKDQFTWDYDKLEAAITEKTKVIIPVDLFGIPADYDRIFEIVDRKKNLYKPSDNPLQKALGRIVVMADAAHSFGASYKGKPVGSIADFTNFSFHAVKNLTTAEGGAVTWKDIEGVDHDELYHHYMLHSLHGQSKDALSKTRAGAWEYDITAPLYKCNMTDVHNGYCFFKYLNSIDTDIDSYYAISPLSKDLNKVLQVGKSVKYGSMKHWILYFACELNISTQKGGKPNAAIGYVLDMLRLSGDKFIFLQHGITINDAKWLYYNNTRMRLFICGAKPEYEYVKKKFGYPYNKVCYLGFCRFDDYHNFVKDKKIILLIPSWREWIGSKNEYSKIYEKGKQFEDTQFFKAYQSLINNDELIQYLSFRDIRILFYPHRNMQKFCSTFSSKSTRITVVDNTNSDIRQLLLKSSLMITDYSSVALDFAYMKKPVIYYQFDAERFFEGQYKKGYYSYEKSGLGKVVKTESDLVSLLIKYVENNYLIENEKEVEAFFALHDNQNCKRTYEYLKGLNR